MKAFHSDDRVFPNLEEAVIEKRLTFFEATVLDRFITANLDKKSTEKLVDTTVSGSHPGFDKDSYSMLLQTHNNYIPSK